MKPKGWPGWPGRKEFAVVLTHDVESSKGVDQVRNLAKAEMDIGFRSSFNFIPEGPYDVPRELLDWLVDNGFEVGVHDLNHDGRLYESRSGFQKRSAKINLYLEKWGAVGFRSGFMLHNLDWIHDLNIGYDASTFDTDPFEPQPDGVDTIFPFWVPRPGANEQDGFVELPYTLAQDSTLFLLFRYANARVWQEKLAWIADRGGMALMNVHPDFVTNGNQPASGSTYPLATYVEFLKWLHENYAQRYWHALPAEVAEVVFDFSGPVRADFNVANADAPPNLERAYRRARGNIKQRSINVR